MQTNTKVLLLLSFFTLSTQAKRWCDSDAECTANLTSKYFCNMTRNICEHESLSEISGTYIAGIIFIIFISAFANAGGIGGGSVIVPVLTILFAYEVNEAIPLSKATIFAGAVINVFFLLNQRKADDPDKSLIDYRLCAFMLPIMMGGTFFGVYLNFIFPPMIIILLLTGYLALSIFSIYKKFKIISYKEDVSLGTTLGRQIKEIFGKMFGSDDESGHGELGKKGDKMRVQEALTCDSEPDQYSFNFEGIGANMVDLDLDLTDIKEINGSGAMSCDFTVEQENAAEQGQIELYEVAEQKIRERISSPFLSEEENPKIDNQIDLSNESFMKPERKPFTEMIKENSLYIMILLLSIVIIMTLSLFKEGVFFSDNTHVSRCSGLGIAVMIIIAMYCCIVSLVAFKVNLDETKRELSEKQNRSNSFEISIQPNIDECQDDFKVQENANSIKISARKRSSLSTLTPPCRFQNVDDNTPAQEESDNYSDAIAERKVALSKLGTVSFVSGIGAGLLGIGGGMIINPFLIMMNYSPMDAAAISSMGVLFTSTISTSEFLIMGAIKFSDLNYFLIFAGIGSLSGVFIIKELIRRFQRPSILLLIILGIFVFAVIVLPGFGFMTIPAQNYFKFGNVCLQ